MRYVNTDTYRHINIYKSEKHLDLLSIYMERGNTRMSERLSLYISIGSYIYLCICTYTYLDRYEEKRHRQRIGTDVDIHRCLYDIAHYLSIRVAVSIHL